jgi:hypothetical protein
MFNLRRYRPLGVADLFDLAFDLYKENARLYMVASLLILFPLQAMLYLFAGPTMNAMFTMVINEPDYDQIMALVNKSLDIYAIATPTYAFFVLLLGGVITDITAKRYLGQPASLGAAFWVSLRRMPRVLLAVIATTLAVSVGSVLCLLPGMYIACRLFMVQQVVILEPDKRYFSSLRRSWNLFREAFWRVAGVLILLQLVATAVFAAVDAFFGLVSSLMPTSTIPLLTNITADPHLLIQVLSTLFSIIVTPFVFIVLTLLYYDARIRQEGYDMNILAQKLHYMDDDDGDPPVERQGGLRPAREESSAGVVAP